EVLRMYLRYGERKGWRSTLMDTSANAAGGIKDASFTLEGEGVYSSLKYESGVHRVQRVPATEAQGRIHTSTVTVAVMPEAEDVEDVIIACRTYFQVEALQKRTQAAEQPGAGQ